MYVVTNLTQVIGTLLAVPEQQSIVGNVVCKIYTLFYHFVVYIM